MSYQLQSEINDLKSEIKERYENLTEILAGKELTKTMQELHNEPKITIDSEKLIVAVDDFMTILKSTKRICK